MVSYQNVAGCLDPYTGNGGFSYSNIVGYMKGTHLFRWMENLYKECGERITGSVVVKLSIWDFWAMLLCLSTLSPGA